jgi:ABC-type branched-subunit amino acid transport system substrate-binding protein
MHKIKTRRQAIGMIGRGAALLAPAGLLGACSGGPIGLETTSAISPKGLGTHQGGEGEASSAQHGVVKAALLLPLGGSIQMSLVAKGLQQAAELALFERNTPNFQLVVRDDKGTPQGAAEAAMTAIADGCEIILGPLLGTSVAAMAPIARQANVPVIAFSNDPANGGRGIHLLSFFASAEASRTVAHAIVSGRRHFAALIPDDALGRDTEPAFRKAVEAGGARVAVVERYPADLSGMMGPAETVMSAIKSSIDSEHPIDALFIPSSGDHVVRLASMLRHHDLDTSKVKLIVSSGWDNPAALREPKVAGAWLAGPEAGGWRELSTRFAKAYNAMPPRLASLAYDAVSVATAFATQPKQHRYTAANLTREQGFAGVDGLFRLTASGPIERSLAVLEIQPQGLVTVDPARGFTPALIGAPSSPTGPLDVFRG